MALVRHVHFGVETNSQSLIANQAYAADMNRFRLILDWDSTTSTSTCRFLQECRIAVLMVLMMSARELIDSSGNTITVMVHHQ